MYICILHCGISTRRPFTQLPRKSEECVCMYVCMYICILWVLVGKPEGKRPLGRPRRRWENNIKIDLQEDGLLGTGWSWLRIGTGGGHL
jgi:hypothetical protein